MIISRIPFSHHLLRSCRRFSTSCSTLHAAEFESDDKSSNQPSTSGQSTPRSKSKRSAASYDGKSASDLLAGAASYSDMSSSQVQDEWSSLPYPKDVDIQIENKAPRVRPPRVRIVDGSEMSILLFPGQGTQFVGMGQRLLKYPNVQQLYEAASSVLNYDLLKLSTEGPLERLEKTIHSQPAILINSLAAIERVREEFPLAIDNCVAAAGFSVGEFAALVFAGSISLIDAIKLVKLRAELMQEACEREPSGLLTVFETHKSKLGLAITAAQNHMKSQGHQYPVCQISNYLFTQCKVIGGHIEALDFIVENCEDFNIHASRLKRLPVSGAFHTPLMDSVIEPFGDALHDVVIKPPRIDVYSNFSSKPYDNVRDIKKQLKKQCARAVRWEQTMHNLYDEYKIPPATYECGPGSQLGTMLKRTNNTAGSRYRPVPT